MKPARSATADLVLVLGWGFALAVLLVLLSLYLMEKTTP